MARPYNDAALNLIPVASARLSAAQAMPRVPPRRDCWSRKLLYVVSNDDLDNRFLVNITPKFIYGAALEDIMFGVHGRDRIEDMCALFFRKLGPVKLGGTPVSAVFHTLDGELIHSGALMADIFKTNQSQSGVCVELFGTWRIHSDTRISYPLHEGSSIQRCKLMVPMLKLVQMQDVLFKT